MEVGHKSHPTMDAETVKKKLLLLFGGAENFGPNFFGHGGLEGFNFVSFGSGAEICPRAVLVEGSATAPTTKIGLCRVVRWWQLLRAPTS